MQRRSGWRAAMRHAIARLFPIITKKNDRSFLVLPVPLPFERQMAWGGAA
jgi:hypothetical protein